MSFTPFPNGAAIGAEHEPYGAGNGTFVNVGPNRWDPKTEGVSAGVTQYFTGSNTQAEIDSAPIGSLLTDDAGTGEFYIRTSDGTSNVWVEYSASAGGGGGAPSTSGLNIDQAGTGGTSGTASFRNSSDQIRDGVLPLPAGNLNGYVPPVGENWLFYVTSPSGGTNMATLVGDGVTSLAAFRSGATFGSTTNNQGWAMRLA